jgi:hypothetical protein
MINKKLKPAILLLIQLLFMQGICGQNQVNMKDYLSQRFLKYCKSVPREEIFIHTDRKEYISGEDLWFNIYLIDRQSFKPSLRSRIVYFELLNSDNRPVVQKRISVVNGVGPGHIELPDSLSTGIYTIRAYTSWMKNFLPFNCFMKDIAVYNTLSNKESGRILNSQVNTTKNTVPDLKGTPVTLRVNNRLRDTLEISMVYDDRFRSENKNIIWLFIQTHGNINFVSSESITPETTIIGIPKKLLSTGINQITVFNTKGEPVGEKYIYTPPLPDKLPFLHFADSCSTRDKITLEIEPRNDILKGLESANMSLVVAPEESGDTNPDLKDYLIFGSEYVPTVSNFFNGRKIGDLGDLPVELIDSMLQNVKSNWINWTSILSGEPYQFKCMAEKEDHILTGKLLTSDQHPVEAGKLILMSTPGKEATFQYARTDDKGNFNFHIHIDEDMKDLIFMPDDVGSGQKVILESSFSDQYLRHERPVDSLKASLGPEVSKLSVNHQVQKIYEISSQGSPLKQESQPVHRLRFYGKPDIELILSEYISLPVMSEIFFELLPDVSLKKRKSAYEIFITYRIEDTQVTTKPCLMIDGVVIKDPAMIANLDPELVEEIDVVKGKYLVGKYFFPGLINVITKTGDFTCVPLPEYMVRMKYRVTEPVTSFVSPDYSTPEMRESRIPDYRNTLYWDPSVKPAKDGKIRIEFWSSDNKSNYLISITKDGKIISMKKVLKVK